MEVVFILLYCGVVPNKHDGDKEEGKEDGKPCAFEEFDDRSREVEQFNGSEEEEKTQG